MREIIIDRVEDLQPGDIATMVISGQEYVGPVAESGGLDGALFWADYLIRKTNGKPAEMGKHFVDALRELPELPTEPLSVITDVVPHGGEMYPLAIRRGDAQPLPAWRVLNYGGREILNLEDHDIASFKLAKVVEA